MINKIKDKQTGEYHDIGGLKCKLVASGNLNYHEEENYFEKSIELKEGKFYLFIYISEFCDNTQTIFCYDGSGVLSLNFLDENEQTRLFTCNVESDRIIFINTPSYLSSGDEYEIYELPIELEV